MNYNKEIKINLNFLNRTSSLCLEIYEGSASIVDLINRLYVLENHPASPKWFKHACLNVTMFFSIEEAVVPDLQKGKRLVTNPKLISFC